MNFKVVTIACVLLSFAFIVGCSSSSTPTLPGDSPTLTGEGHLVLMSGTMVIDTVNMEVRHLEYQVDPIHNSLFDLLTDYLTVGIVEASADQVTLNVEIENPYESQLYDMRIIFTDLNDKTVINHDGFTNFYSSLWNQDYNPFIYFSKEAENHAFPMGPGGMSSENVMLSWFDGVNQNVSYIIECCLDRNTEEPYAVTNAAIFGDITPQGGSVIVKCVVDDWQDDIDSVKILANGFNDDDIGMYKYQDTNIYGGSLVNLMNIQPGDHIIWIQVESANSENLNLRYPVIITVPDTSINAPIFEYEPDVGLSYYTDDDEIYVIKAHLEANAEALEFEPEYGYLWEVLSPSSPQGYFGVTGNNKRETYYWIDVPNQSNEYVFKLSVMGYSNYTSLALVSFPSEIELRPEIVEGPSGPADINEGEWTVLSAVVEDPNRPGNDQYLTFEWTLDDYYDLEDIWGASGYRSLVVNWRAPQVEEDMFVSIRFEVEKTTPHKQLRRTEYLEILIRDLDGM